MLAVSTSGAAVGVSMGSRSDWRTLRHAAATLPDPAAVLRVPGVSLHVYGKTPAPSRKLGHATFVARDLDIAALAEQLVVDTYP